MSDEDRRRWNQRYADGAYVGRSHPSPWLVQWHGQLVELCKRQPARAWDIACGRGRNLRWLRELGFSTLGVDIADQALSAAQAILDQSPANPVQTPLASAAASNSAQWLQCDLDVVDVAAAQRLVAGFDGPAPSAIVVVRYFNLALLPALLSALAPGGLLLVEVHSRTHLVHEQSPVTVGGPGSERFRCPAGALLAAVEPALNETSFELLQHLEGLDADPDGQLMSLARLAVRRAPSAG